MSTATLIVLIIVVVVLALVLGGYLATRRREQLEAPAYEAHVAAADHALEDARAADRGWDRALLEDAVRRALATERPGRRYDALHLVLVDDRPGAEDDRARFVAEGPDGRAQVELVRRERGWAPAGVTEPDERRR